MLYLGVNVPVVGLSVKAAHVSQRESNTDAAQGMQNQAGEALRDSFGDRARNHRGPLETLLDQPSFKSFDPGDRKPDV